MTRTALFCALASLVVVAGCRTRKTATARPDPPPRSAERVMERLLENETDTLRYYSARGNVSLKLPDAGRSFKAHIRLVRDSALWVSVVPALGIEVGRVLLTADTLKVLDKLADHYFVGDTAAARQKFGFRPDLQLLQEALLGKAIGITRFAERDEKYRIDREDGMYVLTSREKRRFLKAADEMLPMDTLGVGRDLGERRMERLLRKAEERETTVLRYWVDPHLYRTTRVQLVDLARDVGADVRYGDRGGPEDQYLPRSIHIVITEPGRQASGTLELSRTSTEGPVEMNFRIPDKFTPMP
jgi:hypothetical protein